LRHTPRNATLPLVQARIAEMAGRIAELESTYEAARWARAALAVAIAELESTYEAARWARAALAVALCLPTCAVASLHAI